MNNMEFNLCTAIQVLLYLMFTESTKLQCPDHSQWNLRFRAFCKTSSMWYYCLYDKNRQQFKEVCSNQESYHKPGFKYVISGNLNGEPCDKHHYQPFKFSMDGNSDCVFLKSTCPEDGQIVYSDGTTKTDITCRCDYSRGYAYVNLPKNTCYCDPTFEDCSCYKKPCAKREVLTADYVCIKQDQWYKDINCPLIKKSRFQVNRTVTSGTHIKSTMPASSFLDLSEFQIQIHIAKLVILIVVLSMPCAVVFFIIVGTRIINKYKQCLMMEEIISRNLDKGIDVYEKNPNDALVEKDEDEFCLLHIKDIHNQHINDWEKDDEKFIEITASQRISESLERDSCVLVVGRAGNGKSSIVRHIALKLKSQKQYEIIPIVLSPSNIFEFINRKNKKRKQIFIVDDWCGKGIINAQYVDVWFSQIDEILKLIDTSDKNDSEQIAGVKFLFATDLHIYNDSIFQKQKLLKKYVFDLSKCPLTDDEKLKMITKYFSPKANIELSKKLRSDKEYFPLLCKIAENKTADQIISLFGNLKDFIKQDLAALKNINNLKFCVITLCALLNNTFKEKILDGVYESDIEEQAFKNVCSEFNLGPYNDQVKSKIKEQLGNKEGMYMTKTGNYYHFIHAKVYRIAVVVCGQTFLHSFIKYVRSSFIAKRFCFQSVMTNSNRNFIIIDNEDAEKRYFDRLMFDLEQGETYSTFHNSQLMSEPYRNKFQSYCHIRKQKISKLLKHYRVNSDTESVTYAERNYEDYIDFKKKRHFFSHKMRKPLIESAFEGYVDIVNMLLDFGCKINEADRFGRTALFVACLLQKTDVVSVLLDHNADHSLCDANGKSALLVASREGYHEIVKALVQKKADVNQNDVEGNSPLIVAAYEGHLWTVQIISAEKPDFSKCNNLGQSPVFVASMNGHTDVLNFLLKHFGEYIYTTDIEGRSPLFIACKNGHRAVVQMLLENHADISQCDWNKRSPLFIASAEGQAEIVKTLIEKNGNINQWDEEGMSPLFIAADKGQKEIVKVLVNKKADINLTDNKKRTPLFAACRRGFIEIVKLLHEQNANTSLCNTWGGSPLFAACRQGHFDIVEYLVRKGNNVSNHDSNGTTPLLVASEIGNTEIVKFLIQRGADINQCDNYKKTPLHVSVVGGHIDVVKVLIDNDAVQSLTDNDNQTPFDLACKHSYTDIVKLLRPNK